MPLPLPQGLASVRGFPQAAKQLTSSEKDEVARVVVQLRRAGQPVDLVSREFRL